MRCMSRPLLSFIKDDRGNRCQIPANNENRFQPRMEDDYATDESEWFIKAFTLRTETLPVCPAQKTQR